jgi:hypothetical protein
VASLASRVIGTPKGINYDRDLPTISITIVDLSEQPWRLELTCTAYGLPHDPKKGGGLLTKQFKDMEKDAIKQSPSTSRPKKRGIFSCFSPSTSGDDCDDGQEDKRIHYRLKFLKIDLDDQGK